MRNIYIVISILVLISFHIFTEEGSDTMTEEFPKNKWEEIKILMENEGPGAVIEFIEGYDKEEDRRKLYSFVQPAFAYSEWEGKNFDDYIAVVQAGIEEGLKQAEDTDDEKLWAKYIDFANVLSYNLSADLAECWPGDEQPRGEKHFKVGLKAAEDCIKWREELNKGPFPFSIAYWAKGMHELSLKMYDEAREDFKTAFVYAINFAKENDAVTIVSPEADFIIILNSGYLGIAEWVCGVEGGKERYQEALSTFEEQKEKYEDKADDADFGIQQLKLVKSKFVE
jgi:hypothetical protein